MITGSTTLSAIAEFYVGIYQMDADTYPHGRGYAYIDGGAISNQFNFDPLWANQGHPNCFAWTTADMTVIPVDCDASRAFICRKDPPGWSI